MSANEGRIRQANLHIPISLRERLQENCPLGRQESAMIFCNLLQDVAVICGENRLPAGNRLPPTYWIRYPNASAY